MLTSYDAWENNVTLNLKNAAKRLGLYKLVSGGSHACRKPYAAIFKVSGKNTPNRVAIEVLQSSSNASESAIIATWLIEDAFVGQNLTNALISGDAHKSAPSVFANQSRNVDIGTTTPNYQAERTLSFGNTIISNRLRTCKPIFQKTSICQIFQQNQKSKKMGFDLAK